LILPHEVLQGWQPGLRQIQRGHHGGRQVQGHHVDALGNEVKVGKSAPDFKVQKSADMSDYTLVSAAT
jgi:hypothetical protein